MAISKPLSSTRHRSWVLACLLAGSALGACTCDSGTLGNAEPKIVVNPTKVDFGTVALGTIADLPVEVTNAGRVPLSIASITLSQSGDFTLPKADMLISDCQGNARATDNPQLVAAGNCARFTVQFQPHAVESVTTNIVITSNDPNNKTVTIPVVAKAADIPCLKVTPPDTMDFGTVTVGQSKELSLTVENCGHIPYELTQLAFSPANSRVFSISATGGLPAVPLTFNPGKSQVLNVTYKPTMPTGSAGDTGEFTIGANTTAIHTQVVKIIGHAAGPECNGAAAPVANIALLMGGSPIGSSVLPLSSVTLSGAGSTAPAGTTISSYTWRLISAPANNMSQITGTGPTAALLCSLAGDYTVGLTVKDGNGCQSPEATATIHVVPGAGIHVQLTWAEDYGDVDLHYVGPGGSFSDDSGPTGGDLYYPYAKAEFNGMTLNPNPFPMMIDWGMNNTVQADGNPNNDPSLDVDQLWGKGPENVTHPHPFAADYEVMAHYYCSSTFDEQSNPLGGGGSSPSLGPATATVTVWFNGNQIWQATQSLTARQVWDAATIHVTNGGNAATVTAGTRPLQPVMEGCPDGN